MASIWPRVRCSRRSTPSFSAASSAWSSGDDVLNRIENLVQEVRKASAVSFQDSRRAQRARKSIRALVSAFAVAPRDFLDGHHAAAAAIDAPHGVKQENKDPHKGMNSKRRWAS